MRFVRKSVGMLVVLTSATLAASCAPAAHSASAASGDAPRVQLCPSTRWSPRAGALDCQFKVDRDAYVLVIATDRARQPHVVYPISSASNGFTPAGQQTAVARIDLGLPDESAPGTSVRRLPSSALVAIVSASPLRLDALKKANGDWDELTITRLLEGGRAIIKAITIEGQPATWSWAGARS